MTKGFLDHMRIVPDLRVQGMVTYPLDEILLTKLVGVVCGGDDWEGIEEVAKGALDSLRQFLPWRERQAASNSARRRRSEAGSRDDRAGLRPRVPRLC